MNSKNGPESSIINGRKVAKGLLPVAKDSTAFSGWCEPSGS